MAQIILPTGTAPATPAAGTVTVYSKTSDKKLYYKDDTGTEAGPLGSSTFTTATLAAGAVNTPSLTTTGDTNTGVWFPAADTVAISTGGSERLRIDANGQISGGNSGGSGALLLTSTVTASNVRVRLTTTSDTSSVAYVLGNSHASVNKQCSVYLDNTNGGWQFQTGQTAGAEPTAGTAAFRIQADFSGIIVSTAALGYGTGAGGAVTQATSRTTGVTLNKPTGAITLFTAAGSATPATFTVTNSIVAATDTVVLSVKSGTNVYLTAVTAVAAGSFNITFWTTGGTASDAPVINFAIIKGATS